MNIVAVDWAKHPNKRSAYHADSAQRRIHRVKTDGSLSQLLEHASRLKPPVVVGIDAAIGFPHGAWPIPSRHTAPTANSFSDILRGGSLPEGFFDTIKTAEDWSPLQPFFAIPAGKGALKAFHQHSNHSLYRQVDQRLGGKPIFAVSGIPGTVGSGTRALWQELMALPPSCQFQLWPFDGDFSTLAANDAPIIAEIYPRACYGIALADHLPATPCSIAKTKLPPRIAAVEALQAATWIKQQQVTLCNLQEAQANEDDFDALFSAAALMRIYLEDTGFDSADSIDRIAEGGVLGETGLTTPPHKPVKNCIAKLPTREPVSNPAPKKYYPCPIEGCDKVFHGGRNGWDAHIAPFDKHPNWHPNIKHPDDRKAQFKKTFPHWFKP